VVDDEPPIRHAVRDALSELTDRMIEADTGCSAIDLCLSERPTLVVLDLGLPDMEGLEVCQAIRRWSVAPIIVLSARHSEAEKVSLLNAGADDYVTKPFSVLELGARARAQLRRAGAAQRAGAADGTIAIGNLSVDMAARRIEREGVIIHLTPIEWQIFSTLLAANGRILTHQQIFDAVWGRQYGNPQQYLRVHITNLRRKVEETPATPQIIITEPGVGYRIELPR